MAGAAGLTAGGAYLGVSALAANGSLSNITFYERGRFGQVDNGKLTSRETGAAEDAIPGVNANFVAPSLTSVDGGVRRQFTAARDQAADWAPTRSVQQLREEAPPVRTGLLNGYIDDEVRAWPTR